MSACAADAPWGAKPLLVLRRPVLPAARLGQGRRGGRVHGAKMRLRPYGRRGPRPAAPRPPGGSPAHRTPLPRAKGRQHQRMQGAAGREGVPPRIAACHRLESERSRPRLGRDQQAPWGRQAEKSQVCLRLGEASSEGGRPILSIFACRDPHGRGRMRRLDSGEGRGMVGSMRQRISTGRQAGMPHPPLKSQRRPAAHASRRPPIPG